MSWFHPEDRELTNEDIESYAHACWDILRELEIFDGHCKLYDPLTIEGKKAHSYVFNMEDGGRSHKFKNLGHLREMILQETINLIKENYETKTIT